MIGFDSGPRPPSRDNELRSEIREALGDDVRRIDPRTVQYIIDLVRTYQRPAIPLDAMCGFSRDNNGPCGKPKDDTCHSPCTGYAFHETYVCHDFEPARPVGTWCGPALQAALAE